MRLPTFPDVFRSRTSPLLVFANPVLCQEPTSFGPVRVRLFLHPPRSNHPNTHLGFSPPKEEELQFPQGTSVNLQQPGITVWSINYLSKPVPPGLLGCFGDALHLLASYTTISYAANCDLAYPYSLKKQPRQPPTQCISHHRLSCTAH